MLCIVLSALEPSGFSWHACLNTGELFGRGSTTFYRGNFSQAPERPAVGELAPRQRQNPRVAALVPPSPASLDARLCQPDAIRKRMACQASQLMNSVMGYAIWGKVIDVQSNIVDNRFRWGSCTTKDHVNFNWRLIKAPMFVIDYVIVHELAHFLEANHTPRFWNIVRAKAPLSEKAKAWLKEHGQLLEEEI